MACTGRMTRDTRGIQSNKLDEWRDYMTRILGLMDVSEDDDNLRFRMDDLSWRIAIEKGDAEDLAYVGLDAGSRADFDALCHQLDHAGHPAENNPERAKARGVRELAVVHDPDGLAVEIYCGKTECAEVPFASPAGVSGFVTGSQGLGHFVLYTPDTEKKLAFYINVLGFSLSDTILMFGQLNLTFLHCNPRHHTLALAEVPNDKHMNHFMIQAETLHDVGFACDRAVGIDALTSTFGCHTNDRMMSFYARTPSGFEVEFGYGARTIDDDWTVAHHNAPSIWGHKPPAQLQGGGS